MGEERLCDGLMITAADGALIVEGAPRRHVFHGKAATEVLPKLMNLLDGSRTPEELADASGLSSRQLDQALNVLRDRGLLEEGAPAPGNHVTTYLSRNLPDTGGYLGTADLMRDFADSAVHVVADDLTTADLISADLRESGIGWCVSGAVPPAEDQAAALENARRALVIVVADPREPARMDEAVAWCAPRGIPVLRVAATAEHVELGPWFLTGYTACPSCLRRSRAEAGWEPESETHNPLMAGTAVAEALAILGGIPVIAPGGTMARARIVARIALAEPALDRHLVTPYPDCGTCAWSDPSPMAAYEWAQEGDAPPGLTVSTSATPFEIKPWEGLKTLRTPSLPAHPRRPLGDDPLLAELLRKTAGYRRTPEAPLQRWVPSGGNLASAELYLIGEVPGLPGTVFRYDDVNDTLIAMSPDRVPLAEALAGTDLRAEGLSAVFVLVAGRRRLEYKYADFSHHLAHLDAGCAATQLALLAAERGARVEYAATWDERPAGLLSLIPDQQIVTAIAGLHRGIPCP
ncbi:hypothetical protein [Nonomuraea typhae]|uniref:hypothetical protein n=1 Tax=Nonomuraea typhae TaxID=2603600 RepID=UPI0012FAE2C3|nr:hypothetical protein [Nonomuraea typhae]